MAPLTSGLVSREPAGLAVCTHQSARWGSLQLPPTAPHRGLLGALAAPARVPSLSPVPTACPLLAGPRPPAAHLTIREMGACGRKALTLLSSVFAVCGLGLLGIAVSTDYWLYLEEGVVLPQNQSTEIRMSLHSGLWRVCFLAGKGTG